MNRIIVDKIRDAASADSDILCSREDLDTTLGSDAKYLEDVLSITKSDLIRLEREGYAIKARYTTKTGEHRVRWIIFKEVLNA